MLTKCVRVSSTATTRAVVDALAEKFLPDLKMLSDDTYSLWEVSFFFISLAVVFITLKDFIASVLKKELMNFLQVHESGGERRLDDEEKPLLVQLTWHRDDREGRFLLRKNRQDGLPLSVRFSPHPYH